MVRIGMVRIGMVRSGMARIGMIRIGIVGVVFHFLHTKHTNCISGFENYSCI